jgi:hypothetical protein
LTGGQHAVLSCTRPPLTALQDWPRKPWSHVEHGGMKTEHDSGMVHVVVRGPSSVPGWFVKAMAGNETPPCSSRGGILVIWIGEREREREREARNSERQRK